MDDKLIVQLYLNRDESAIACTKDKYGSRIKGIAYEITSDYESSEECESDTYLNAWNSIPPNEPYDYLYPYLVHIVKNLALKICRSKNTLKRKASVEELTQELMETIPGSIDVDVISDNVIRDILNGYLRSLSDDKRNIFIRRYWYQDTIAEIASDYGMGESKVKVLLFRCRKQLRLLFEKEGISV